MFILFFFGRLNGNGMPTKRLSVTFLIKEYGVFVWKKKKRDEKQKMSATFFIKSIFFFKNTSWKKNEIESFLLKKEVYVSSRKN